MSDLSKPMTQLQAYILMVLLVLMTLTFLWHRTTNVTASQHSLKVSCQTQYLAAVYAMYEPKVRLWTEYLTAGRTPTEVLELPQCRDNNPPVQNIETKEPK